MELRGYAPSYMQSVKNLPNYIMTSESLPGLSENSGETGVAKRSV